jgi:hypothetical protein
MKTPDKEWTREQVRALVELAESKGISRSEFAKEYLGVHPTTLSYWMSTTSSYREPRPYHKKLLSCIEPTVRKIKT